MKKTIEQLKQYHETSGKSIRTIAKELNISHSYLSQVFNKKTNSISEELNNNIKKYLASTLTPEEEAYSRGYEEGLIKGKNIGVKEFLQNLTTEQKAELFDYMLGGLK